MRRFDRNRHWLDEDEETKRRMLRDFRLHFACIFAIAASYFALHEAFLIPGIFELGFMGYWVLLITLPLGALAGLAFGWAQNWMAGAVSGAIASAIQTIASLLFSGYYWTEEGQIFMIAALMVIPAGIGLGCFFYILRHYA